MFNIRCGEEGYVCVENVVGSTRWKVGKSVEELIGAWKPGEVRAGTNIRSHDQPCEGQKKKHGKKRGCLEGHEGDSNPGKATATWRGGGKVILRGISGRLP